MIWETFVICNLSLGKAVYNLFVWKEIENKKWFVLCPPPPSGSPRIPDAWLEIFYFLLIYIYIFLELKTHFLYCFVMHFSLIFDYCLLFIILYGFSRWCLGSLGWEWGEKSRGRGEVTFGSSVQEPRCTRMHCFFLRSCIIIQATLGVLRASRTTPQVSGI